MSGTFSALGRTGVVNLSPTSGGSHTGNSVFSNSMNKFRRTEGVLGVLGVLTVSTVNCKLSFPTFVKNNVIAITTWVTRVK